MLIIAAYRRSVIAGALIGLGRHSGGGKHRRRTRGG
jgi:hypothetical protein